MHWTGRGVECGRVNHGSTALSSSDHGHLWETLVTVCQRE